MLKNELKLESRGEDVRVLQTALSALGYTVAADERERGFYGEHTAAATRAFQTAHGLEGTGIADETTIGRMLNALTVRVDKEIDRDSETERYVQGTVTYADGRNASWVRVGAFDRHLRSDHLLAESVTDNLGRYWIRYQREHIPGSDESGPDLAVKVFGEHEEAVYDPTIDQTVFKAPLQQTVNISLTSTANLPGARISEFELIELAVEPLVRGVSIAELQQNSTNQDITYLNKQTGISTTNLTYFVVAYRLNKALPKVKPDFFYALMREGVVFQASSTSALTVRVTVGLDTDITSLLYDIVLMDSATITTAIGEAVTEKTVPASANKNLKQDLDALEKLETVASNYVQNTQSGQTVAVAQSFLTPTTIDAATTLFSTDAMGDLSGLATKVSQLAMPPETVTPVDAATVTEWNSLLGLKSTANESTTAAFSASLRQDMTSSIGSALAGAPVDKKNSRGAATQKALADFLDGNPDFDLAKDNVKAYARKKPEAFSGSNAQALKDSLTSVRRVFRMAPTHSQTSALMAAGIKSADNVKALGKKRFVKLATATGEFSTQEAASVFHNAVNLSIASGLTAGKVVSALRGKAPALSPKLSKDTLQLVDQDFPNLQTLFGLGDQCECDECNSVYGPAAYLVELLQFLEARQVLDTTANPAVAGDAQAALKARRSDLYDVDLNCANAMTEMSFIDYVCELLEDAVAPVPNSSYSGALTQGMAPASLVTALQNAPSLQDNPMPFTALTAIYGPDSDLNFVARDTNVSAKLTRTSSNVYRITQMRQTFQTSDQLMAAPEYTNPKAYNVLLNSTYAFELPFDLYHEECESYFAQAGVQRSSLMSAMQVDNVPAYQDIAADSLGIPPVIHKLIVTVAPASQAKYWNNTLTNIAFVDIFLNVSGLQFADLQTLVSLPFIQGVAPAVMVNTFIQSLDSSCELHEKVIANLNDDVLDRMHRFLRLMNATGWDMTSLNYAICAPNIGNGVLDDNCLTRLAGVNQLITNLGLSQDQADSFYGPIPSSAFGIDRSADDATLYNSLFLNTATILKVQTLFTPANVRANEAKEAATPGSGATLLQNDAYIGLAVGAATSDVDLLIQRMPGNQIVSVANLAAIFACVTLAQNLQLTVTDFLSLNDLITGDMTLKTLFETPANTLNFISKVGDVSASGVAPADLVYLLTHAATNLSSRELSPDVIAATLGGLQSGIQSAFTKYQNPFVASATVAQNSSALRTLVQSVPGFGTADLSTLSNVVAGLIPNGFAPFLNSKLGTCVSNVLTLINDASAINAQSLDSTAQQTFLQDACSQVSAFLYLNAKAELVASALANGLSLDPLVAAVVRDYAVLRQGASSGTPTVGAALGNDFLIDVSGQTTPNPPAISEAIFPDQYRAIRLAQTISTFLANFPITASELTWLMGYAGIFQSAASNTGNGTCSPLTVLAGAVPGQYEFSCTQLGANAVFSGKDPHANPLAQPLVVGSQYNSNGLNFLVTPGSAPYEVGDTFTVVTPIFAAKLGNTGNGTCGLITEAAAAVSGVYTFTCTVAGPTATFSTTDPNGVALSELTVGTLYTAEGLSFTITGGSVNYVAGDSFTVTTATFTNAALIHGDGTCGTVVLSSAAIPGTYTFTCQSIGSESVFEGTDPNGNGVGTLTVGTPYNTSALSMSLTGGTTPYAVGDSFAVTVTEEIGFTNVQNSAGITGNGISTPIAVMPGAVPGTYHFSCTAAGTFSATDSTGAALAPLTVGAVFVGGGLSFTLNAGTTPFKVGDSFAIEVTVKGPFGTFDNAHGATGNGACWPVSVSANSIPGDYVFACTAAGPTANFSAVDPLGNALPALTIGTAYSAGGLNFTVSSGSTAYAVNDRFVVSAMVGWLQLDNLPCVSGDLATPFYVWDQFYNILALRTAYPPVQPPGNPSGAASLFQTVGTLHQSGLIPNTALTLQVLTQFAALTGFDLTMLQALDQHLQFSVPDLAAYTQVSTYLQLINACGLLRTLRLTAAQGITLSTPQLSQSNVGVLTAALQSQYSPLAWLNVLKSVQDRLREQKRDALVAYLLATNTGFTTSDDLFDYFLIDVETESCQTTSRIVQAHQTIQLFVQRCLSGLEPKCSADLVDDALGWQEWSWMSAYRVWQVQMEIFLYPAGYLDPTLLTNASFLYTDALNSLTQNAPTDSTASDTIEAYMEGLDEISFLDVLAVHYEAATFITHVFGRSKTGDPPTYYYRQFQQESSWTPWEVINLDLTGDDLVAFDIDGRLFLAWPVITLQAYPAQSQTMPDLNSSGKKVNPTQSRYSVKMAISQRSGDTWLPKRISTTSLETPYGYPVNSNVQPTIADPSTLRFFFLNTQSAGASIVFTITDPTQMITTTTVTEENFLGMEFVWNMSQTTPVQEKNEQLIIGSFSLFGCKGYPVAVPYTNKDTDLVPLTFVPNFKNTTLQYMRFAENSPSSENDLSMSQVFQPNAWTQICAATPGIFDVTYPNDTTIIDLLLLLLFLLERNMAGRDQDMARGEGMIVPYGTMMPFFYEDNLRGYALVPGFYPRDEEQNQGSITQATISTILEMINEAIKVFKKFITLIQGGSTVIAALKQIVKDPDYLSLLKEYFEIRRYRYGIQFLNFYHPVICMIRTAFYQSGLQSMMSQQLAFQTDFKFKDTYQPQPIVVQPYPQETLEFAINDAYAVYNWELFYHLPFLLGNTYSANQSFDDADTCFKYVFNPNGANGGAAPGRYWLTKPFIQMSLTSYNDELIQNLLNQIAGDPFESDEIGLGLGSLMTAIQQWRENPFEPYTVAEYRPVEYMKGIVIAYCQMTLNRADSLFTTDQREQITQATQYYILVDKLLGPAPRVVPPTAPPPSYTYNQLQQKFDQLGNAMLDFQDLIPDVNLLPQSGAELPNPPSSLTSLYFCIPDDENITNLRATVQDRLTKIRNCKDINGNDLILALFSPRLNPMDLIRAAAAGISISSLIQGMNAPLPYYRFTTMAQKATDFAQHLSSMLSALLQAQEKEDAETLTLIRSAQEIKLNQDILKVKQGQLSDAQQQVVILNDQEAVTNAKIQYYSSRPFMNAGETTSVVMTSASLVLQAVAIVLDATSGGTSLVPQVEAGGAGAGGSPVATVSFGGQQLGPSSSAFSQAIHGASGILSNGAGLASTLGGYQRRQDDWTFQLNLANLELAQIKDQIAAATIRVSIAQQEVDNEKETIANLQALDQFYHSKFTNQQLYSWMVGQLSSLCYEGYKLAFTTAMKAQRCFQYELASPNSYIQFQYWDAAKKGLLSADALLNDIKTMEAAYLDLNQVQKEMTKHISIGLLDPIALLYLKETGQCIINLPEALFDMDAPGQYRRRIKTIALTIPCVAGPYTSVSCKLTLLTSRYRNSPIVSGPYVEQPPDDPNFVYNPTPTQSITTSSGQNDSARFELNLHDERYLDFEGAGAISQWMLELPTPIQQFDYNTITDVIMHMRYMALDAGSALQLPAVKELVKELKTPMNSLTQIQPTTPQMIQLWQAISMKDYWPNAWQQLRSSGTTTVTVNVTDLPFFAQSGKPKAITNGGQPCGFQWLARMLAPASFSLSLSTPSQSTPTPVQFSPLAPPAQSYGGTPTWAINFGDPITISGKLADLANLKDLVIVVAYELSGLKTPTQSTG